MSLLIQFHPSVEPPQGLSPFPAETLVEMLLEEGVPDEGVIDCILTDDGELARLNERFRGRTGPTNVLAFPYDPGRAEGHRGDIYVSVDRAREQARQRSEAPATETWRLFIHGALHLAGRDHDTPESERFMLDIQERWVKKL